jgi:hypothetical protein
MISAGIGHRKLISIMVGNALECELDEKNWVK